MNSFTLKNSLDFRKFFHYPMQLFGTFLILFCKGCSVLKKVVSFKNKN